MQLSQAGTRQPPVAAWCCFREAEHCANAAYVSTAHLLNLAQIRLAYLRVVVASLCQCSVTVHAAVHVCMTLQTSDSNRSALGCGDALWCLLLLTCSALCLGL